MSKSFRYNGNADSKQSLQAAKLRRQARKLAYLAWGSAAIVDQELGIRALRLTATADQAD